MGANDEWMNDLEWALWFSSHQQCEYRIRNKIRASDEDWERYNKIAAKASKSFINRTGIANYGDKGHDTTSISGE